MKLIIFDLDQTLVDFIAVHDRATQELFKRYFGVEVRLMDIDFAGKSLVDNFVELAILKGIAGDTIRNQSRELLDSYEQIFGKLIPEDTDSFILPGVKNLLDELSRSDNLIILYTGDSPGIVSRVFQVTGLGKYFLFSVYGTEAESRTGMIQLAINRAKKITGKEFQGKEIVIIGDSVRDIDSGKAFQALTIAVATGFHTPEELMKHQPDFLFPSLKDYLQVIEAIG
jgi:phosphoglycolate phosphatase